MRVVLVDLSSVVHPIFHMSSAEQERDPDHVSNATVAKVRSLIEGFDRVGVCCDSGRSFRHEMNPEYKANRGEPNEVLKHQARRAQELLAADGLAVFSVKDYEADDLIATAVAQLSVHPDVTEIMIASSDKDLMQLITDSGRVPVRARSIMTGSVYDTAMVRQKFGVGPEQMCDFLAMVGDVSDNVKGIKGVGAVGAAKLLETFGSAETMYMQIEAGEGKALELKPKMHQSLKDGFDTFIKAKQLILLAPDVPMDATMIMVERTSAAVEAFVAEESMDAPVEAEIVPPVDSKADPKAEAPQVQDTRVERGVTSMVPVDFKLELEPRDPESAITLSKHMFASRLFSAYGTPQAVLATIMAGRELGLSSMASLRGFHVIEGRPALSAGLIQALVLRSGKAQYFSCTERTAEGATFETWRTGDPRAISLSFTLEEARAAGYVKDKSAWMKTPADLCVARAASKLARLVYPDVVFGLYDPDELRDSIGGDR